MTDRERRIVEVVKIYTKGVCDNDDAILYAIQHGGYADVVRLCDALITDGAAVLTKEEYEDIQARMAYLQEEIGKLLRGDNVSVSAREYGQLLYANENAKKEIDKAVEERTIAIIRDLIGHKLEDDGWTWVISKNDVKFLEEKFNVEAE